MNNLPRQELCKIIKVYGKPVCSDYKRIRGLLNDFCRGNYPEINFLLTALEEKVDVDLLTSSKTLPYEMISARLAERLYANRGMANEIASWAIASWAIALGVISDEPLYPTAAISFNVPQPGYVSATKSSIKRTVQQIIVVSPAGGHYTSINEAIRNAPTDAFILVKPGYYYEGLVIGRRIKIKGDGPKEKIIVESRDTSCIQMQTDDEVLVQGLTLRCRASLTNQRKHAVEIPVGRLKLIECDITSDTQACVAIRGLSTRPEIQSCRLHDANGSGLLFEGNAQGTIEDCEIFGNRSPNIAIRHSANPVIRKCEIYGGKSHGILVWENGTGIIEDCEIFGNASDGIKARDSKKLIVMGCGIYKNARQETWVYQNNMGNMKHSNITASTGIRQKRSNPSYRSDAVLSSEKYTTENAAQSAIGGSATWEKAEPQ